MPKAKRERPVLAYAVTENGEDTGGIVFAKHSIVAARQGSCEYADGDIQSVRCRRAPWADWCAPSGIVPASLMIDHGWHFECSSCGETIDEYFLEGAGLTVDDVIGTQNSLIFCCPACKLNHDAARAREKSFAAVFTGLLKEVVIDRFGEVEVFESDSAYPPHIYVVDVNRQPVVHHAELFFRFPGMAIGPGSIKIDWPARSGVIGPRPAQFFCCAGDRDAFEAFAATTKDHSRAHGDAAENLREVAHG